MYVSQRLDPHHSDAEGRSGAGCRSDRPALSKPRPDTSGWRRADSGRWRPPRREWVFKDPLYASHLSLFSKPGRVGLEWHPRHSLEGRLVSGSRSLKRSTRAGRFLAVDEDAFSARFFESARVRARGGQPFLALSRALLRSEALAPGCWSSVKLVAWPIVADWPRSRQYMQ